MFNSAYTRTPVNIWVVRLSIQQTGTYTNQAIRPYVTYMDHAGLNSLTNRLESMGPMSKITGSMFSGMTGNLITPSANPIGIVPIENGWGETRGRFILEVACEFTVGGPMRYFVQGYTDQPGFTRTGYIDPQMNFFINSITTVSTIQRQTPIGMQEESQIVGTSHVLGNHNYNSFNMSGTPQFLLRASDIFTGMQVQSLAMYNPNEGVTDTRSRIGSIPTPSNRKNNIPADYIASVVDGYMTGRNAADYGQSDLDIIGQSKLMVAEEPISSNPFIAAISSFYGVSAQDHFTIKDLTRIDPSAENKTAINWLTPADQALLPSTGSAEHWMGTSRTTVVAAMLANAVPALMMEYLIHNVILQSTNNSLDGSIVTTLIDARSITNVEMTAHFNAFIRRLEREVIYDFTWGNQERYDLYMEVDLFGDTHITLQLGNEPPTPFVVPSFSDGLITPVITTDYASYNNLVDDFGTILGAFREAGTNPQSNQSLI
jgi:hypothetical protein